MSDTSIHQRLRAANPVPDPESLVAALSDRDSLTTWEEATDMDTKPYRAQAEKSAGSPKFGILVAGAALVAVAIGYGALREPGPTAATTPSGNEPISEPATVTADVVALQFWEAVQRGDNETALSLVDPSMTESSDVLLFGRAQVLERQFDWYEAVDFAWRVDGCELTSPATAACQVTGSNAWTEALGVEPVSSTYEVTVEQSGITLIADGGEFQDRWSGVAFLPFANWVGENHPEDADTMFDRDRPVDAEMLELYRTNTDRFVEAHGGP